jgi:hypothetical protein
MAKIFSLANYSERGEGRVKGGGGEAGEGSRHLPLKSAINHALTTRTIFSPFIALELKRQPFFPLDFNALPENFSSPYVLHRRARLQRSTPPPFDNPIISPPVAQWQKSLVCLIIRREGRGR